MSWFAAQKYCHAGGWTMGAVTGAAMEREIVRHWQTKLGQWQQRTHKASFRDEKIKNIPPNQA